MTRQKEVLAVLLVLCACSVTYALQHDYELDHPQAGTDVSLFQRAYQGGVDILKWVRLPCAPWSLSLTRLLGAFYQSLNRDMLPAGVPSVHLAGGACLHLFCIRQQL
jgi:hypothetical protein